MMNANFESLFQFLKIHNVGLLVKWMDFSGFEEKENKGEIMMTVEEELRILKAKLELLDILNDKGNYLDYEILNSDGFFRRSELEGLFDEALLENYDYREERC